MSKTSKFNVEMLSENCCPRPITMITNKNKSAKFKAMQFIPLRIGIHRLRLCVSKISQAPKIEDVVWLQKKSHQIIQYVTDVV